MLINKNKLTNRSSNRSTGICSNGMVAASQPLATQAGVDILKAGGNAVDAAITANAVLGVVEPMSCGLGGDLFAIVWIEKEQKLLGLNASGRAPYDWSIADAKKMALDEIPTYGPLSWSVPGCVDGWDRLRERFGTLGWMDLLKVAIQYAHDGFQVTPIISRYWQQVAFKSYPSLAATFAPDGKPPLTGEVFRNPGLARTLKSLAAEGSGTFYHGNIAERIVKASEANGGRFSRRDFDDHASQWIEPVTSSYRGYDVWQLPPNTQGIAALQILNILENFDLVSHGVDSPEYMHLFIEAKKLTFEDRANYYADPGEVDIPVTQLISKEYAQQRAKLIDRRRAAQQVAAGDMTGSSDTVYLTTADKEGNMVSLIQSIYHGFGSHEVPDSLGFALQNRGSSFALDPVHANCLKPHQRPFHTIMPGFVTQGGRPRFSLGVMGGDFQPQGQAQVLINMLDFGQSVQQAGEQPRFAHLESSTSTGRTMVGGGRVSCEAPIPAKTKQALVDLGHEVLPEAATYGGYQGIWREDEPLRYCGGSDPRKDGCASGY